MLQSSLLRAAGFAHGFTTRAVDFRPVRPPRTAEEASHPPLPVEAVALAARFDGRRLFLLSQVHGRDVLDVDRWLAGPPTRAGHPEGDALLARSAGSPVGVRVADCVPILLADTTTRTVAAVHAGWRGVALGVIDATRAAADEAGARFDVAAIGPCIGPCCFEVGADVAEKIAAATTPDVVARRAGDKAWVDLRRAARHQLTAIGLRDDRVEDVPGCTYCDAERFFSHRRDGEASGRHLAFIVAPGP